MGVHLVFALVLDEPTNQWAFAPEAARALRAMGKEAEEALPALRRAINSNYGVLKLAAERALDMIGSSAYE